MPNWSATPRKPQTICVWLFSQFSNYCLANAIEPLRAANTLSGRNLYRWTFVTSDGTPATSSSGLPVLPQGDLRRAEPGDYLFVMPSYGVRGHATVDNCRMLRAAADRFQHIVGLDTGSWLMAQAGLLDGRRATIHWDEFTAFAETFDTVEAATDNVCTDGKYLTCGGVSTTFELVLNLIGGTDGAALRLEVASLFQRDTAAGHAIKAISPTGSALADRAVALIQQWMEQPLQIGRIAARLDIPQRRLEQVFRTHLGATPQAVYKRLRLRAARRLIETTDHPIAEIALRCGYQNPAAMTRAFRREFGITPTDLRKGSDHAT